MAKEDKTQYDSLRATEIVEFFSLYDVYTGNIERKRKSLTQSNNKYNERGELKG